MSFRRFAFCCSIAALALVLLPGAAVAKKKKKKKAPTIAYEELSQFAVAFTCGTNDDPDAGIQPGAYSTVINVHNADGATQAQALISLSHPVSTESDRVGARFSPMQSRQLSCEDLMAGGFVFPEPPPASDYYQGFVVIRTRGSLDVVTTYTATANAEVSTDVETSKPRKIRREVVATPRTVTICHIPPGNPDNAHTIDVDESSVLAHVSHGDYTGECEDVR